MLLGSRGEGRIVRLGRCVLVWMSGTAGLAVLAAPAWPTAAGAWAARRSAAMLGLDVALGDLAAIVLLGCLGWAWLALTVTVAEALGGSRGCDVRRGRAPWRLPPSVRRLVLAACGVALTTAAAPPAIAGGDSGRPPLPGAAVLRGLPLPDRAVAPPRTAAASRTSSALGRHWVVVRAGDCLWSIAARELAPDAPPSAVVSRWHALYAVNRGRIGPDPDVLEPGQRLLLPGRDPS